MSGRDYIVSTFFDGDTLIEIETCHKLVTEDISGTMVFLTVTMPVLRNIEKVIEIHVTNNTSPPQAAFGVTAVRVTQPGLPGTGVIGFTLQGIASTGTICTNIAAVGF